ncbi:MAG: DUF5995 family protein [bacterium]
MTHAHTTFVVPQTIDEVLAALDAIIARAIDERDRLGYFAVLYRTVTAAVKDGIAAGRFEDGPRMEHLDVAFATRYLRALDDYRRGVPTSRSWKAAFDAGSHSRVVIMQHLLLGMNAHINLDLGVAAAETCPGAALAGLEHDFNEINTVLSTLETDVEREVCSLSPWIDRLDHIDPNAGRVISNFSIDRARECSWQTAQRLAVLTGAERDAAIGTIDDDVAILAHLVERPMGILINFNLVLVRLRETWDVRKVIRVLSGQTQRN